MSAVYEQIVQEQTALRPQNEEKDERVPRYFFNPFMEQGLTPMYQAFFGLTSVRAHIIQPLTEFDQQGADFTVVQRVKEGDFYSVGAGVSDVKRFRRKPLVNLKLIISDYGMIEGRSNGLTEIHSLFDSTDFALLRDLQMALLPAGYAGGYKTAREQVEALDKADVGKRPAIFAEVKRELLAACNVNLAWANNHYDRLVNALEQGRKGGLSELDSAVCRWIELPEPKYQTRLAQAATAQAAPLDTGKIVSDVLAATMPTLMEMAKASVQPAPAMITETAPVASFDKDDPMDENETAEQKTERQRRLEQRQAEMKADNKNRGK